MRKSKSVKVLILPYKGMNVSTLKIIAKKSKVSRIALPSSSKITLDDTLSRLTLTTWENLESETGNKLKILLYPSPSRLRAIYQHFDVIIPFTNKQDLSPFKVVVPDIKVYKSRSSDDSMEFPVLDISGGIHVQEVSLPTELLPIRPSRNLVTVEKDLHEAVDAGLDPVSRILRYAENHLTSEEMALLMKILSDVGA